MQVVMFEVAARQVIVDPSDDGLPGPHGQRRTVGTLVVDV